MSGARVFRVIEPNGDVTQFGGGYPVAKEISANLPGAQIQICEWFEHWPCCAHRIGTCECDGETCCVTFDLPDLLAASAVVAPASERPHCQVAGDPELTCQHYEGQYRCEVLEPHGPEDCRISDHTVSHALAGNGYTCEAIESGTHEGEKA